MLVGNRMELESGSRREFLRRAVQGGVGAALGVRGVAAQDTLPTEWIDRDTGHRVIRLSREDGTQSLYFNQNAYTADGKKLIVTTAGGGIATITLATREVKPLVAGPVSVLVAGHKTGDVYYTKRRWRRRGAAGYRVRHQCRYGRHARGRQTAAGTKRLVAQCGRDAAARHLCGRRAPPAPAAQPAARRRRALRAAELRGRRRGRQADDLRRCQGSAAAQHADGDARRRAARPVHGQYQDRRTQGYLPRARVAGASAVLAHRSATSSCSATRARGTRWTASGRSTPTAPA